MTTLPEKVQNFQEIMDHVLKGSRPEGRPNAEFYGQAVGYLREAVGESYLHNMPRQQKEMTLAYIARTLAAVDAQPEWFREQFQWGKNQDRFHEEIGDYLRDVVQAHTPANRIKVWDMEVYETIREEERRTGRVYETI